jgi:hypothetical protein
LQGFVADASDFGKPGVQSAKSDVLELSPFEPVLVLVFVPVLAGSEEGPGSTDPPQAENVKPMISTHNPDQRKAPTLIFVV